MVGWEEISELLKYHLTGFSSASLNPSISAGGQGSRIIQVTCSY